MDSPAATALPAMERSTAAPARTVAGAREQSGEGGGKGGSAGGGKGGGDGGGVGGMESTSQLVLIGDVTASTMTPRREESSEARQVLTH